jgi:hypothetical protein
MAGQNNTAAEPASGMTRKLSDSALRERTGRGWNEWFGLLDAWGANRCGHAEIARWLIREHRIDNWSAQSVTVGYEQARGMRVPGQQSSGVFAASVSKVVGVPVDRLFQAFTDDSLRGRWLPDMKIHVSTSTARRSLRANLADGTRIVAGFLPKGEARAQVALVHERLPGSEAVTQAKAYWQERLTVLKELLERGAR